MFIIIYMQLLCAHLFAVLVCSDYDENVRSKDDELKMKKSSIAKIQKQIQDLTNQNSSGSNNHSSNANAGNAFVLVMQLARIHSLQTSTDRMFPSPVCVCV